MTNNELITELVKYDGWEYESEEWDGMYKLSDAYWYKVEDNDTDGLSWEKVASYLTDMNILHRIAVKVTAQLKEMYSDDSHDTSFDFEHDMKVTEVKGSVISAMFTLPNDKGEHIQLAEALVNAIRYISANKAG